MFKKNKIEMTTNQTNSKIVWNSTRQSTHWTWFMNKIRWPNKFTWVIYIQLVCFMRRFSIY